MDRQKRKGKSFDSLDFACDPNDSLSFPGSVKWKKQGRSLGDKFLQLVVHPQNQIPVTCKSIKRIRFLKIILFYSKTNQNI
jgi:hypothetical protein